MQDESMQTSSQGSVASAAQRKQVFIAYSYKLYPKEDYRRIYRELEADYDVTFIFADEKITNMHIMKKIETFIRGSDFSIFDISGWNPNVTLELGFAMPINDQWYIAIDPSKTEVNEVPSDLRGLDRIQYGSYSELQTKLTTISKAAAYRN
jgi:predicted nucleotide-binding protein